MKRILPRILHRNIPIYTRTQCVYFSSAMFLRSIKKAQLLNQQAREAIMRGDVQTAANINKLALYEKHKDDALRMRLLTEQTILLIQLDQPDEAEKILKDLEPNFSERGKPILEALYSYVTAKYGDFQKSYEMMKDAISLESKYSVSPLFLDILYSQGMLLMDNDPNKVIELFESMLDIVKNDAEFCLQNASTLRDFVKYLGMAYYLTRNLERSIECNEIALNLTAHTEGKENSTFAIISRLQGKCLFDSGKYEDALPHLDKANQIFSDLYHQDPPTFATQIVEVSTIQTLIYIILNRFEEALKVADRGLKIANEHSLDESKLRAYKEQAEDALNTL